jgi:hypothetical protein
MKSSFRKIAVVLVLMLLVTATGCGGGTDSRNQQASSNAQTGSASQAQASTSAPAKDPVTLTIYSEITWPGQFPTGVQTDEVSKEIERVTGVTLDWDMQPSEDKTKAMMASGDLPDIFIPKDTKFADTLIKSSSIMEMDALLATNGQEAAKTAATAIEYSKKYLSTDTGKLYFLPGRVSGKETFYSPVIGLFMRWDYYKEIGAPEIKTDDDVINVVSQILKKHPTTDDGQKVFGFSPWFDWGLWSGVVLHQEIFGVYANQVGAEYDAVNFDYIDRINDDSSDLWVDGKLLNKAYRKGLLDPDTFTQKYDAASAKMDAGRVVCQMAQWLTDKINTDLAKSGKADAGYVSIPWTGARYHAGNYNPIGLASYWSISSKCKAPDRAMDVINYFFSVEGSRTILSGVKGKYWVEENGNARLTDVGLNAKSDSNFITTTGIHKFQNLTGIDMLSKDANGQFIDLFLEPDILSKTLTSVKKDWLNHYGAGSEDELWRKYNGYAANTAFSALFPQPDEDTKRLDAKITTYLTTNMPRVWMAKTDAEFEASRTKIKEDIKKMDGYNQYVETTRKAIEDTKALMKDYN